jgi:aspartate ammonia-lyase
MDLSSCLKVTALSLIKISNDLRLMTSGPRAGFGEITLPARQPGSSIMPGKVNPVIPEVMDQTCYQVIGNDFRFRPALTGFVGIGALTESSFNIYLASLFDILTDYIPESPPSDNVVKVD